MQQGSHRSTVRYLGKEKKTATGRAPVISNFVLTQERGKYGIRWLAGWMTGWAALRESTKEKEEKEEKERVSPVASPTR